MLKEIKIDFGSGYNPRKGFMTCDFVPSPNLDFLFTGDDIINQYGESIENINIIYIRNVLHHIEELDNVLNLLYNKLSYDGIIIIEEARKEYYAQNYTLDCLWYRYVLPRDDIWFSEIYRDYKSILETLGLVNIKWNVNKEKEMSIWLKRKEHNHE